ncbi:MAG: hypothetical protein RR623_09110 [Bacilli bacterium]|uniref:hypothetical protein n=1 Tax=Anaerorhabdus sp. TaxID=1872524 RepID=UPI003A87761C
MKKILIIFTIILVSASSIPVFAKEGFISDERVDYNYWDQEHINTYWTGVYNKIDYNYYAPCVAIQNSDVYGCGPYAYKSQYQEGFMSNITTPHMHFLMSKTGSNDYIIK